MYQAAPPFPISAPRYLHQPKWVAPWCRLVISLLLAQEKVGNKVWRKSSGLVFLVKVGEFGSKSLGLCRGGDLALALLTRVLDLQVGAAPLAAVGSRCFAWWRPRRRELSLYPLLSREQSCRGVKHHGRGCRGSAAVSNPIYFWWCLLAERNQPLWARLGVALLKSPPRFCQPAIASPVVFLAFLINALHNF